MKTDKIIFFGNNKYDYKLFEDNILFLPFFDYSNKPNIILKTWSYFISIVNICLKLVKHKPKIIHIQWVKFWLVDFAFLILLKLFKIKIIYTAHNILPHESKRIDFFKYYFYYKFTDRIIVHSFSTKKELLLKFKLESNKIKVIKHGVLDLDLDLSLVEKEKEKILENLNLKGKIVFSVLGYQSLYKGCDLIAAVWSGIKELHDSEKYQLIIWGKNKGVDYSSLYNIGNVNIRDEYISNEEFGAVIKTTSILLMPYKVISQSGLLFTAINENKPVIVSDVGGISEPLKYGNIGVIMEDYSTSGLFFAMEKIVINLKNGIYKDEEFEKVKKEYSWEKISNETELVYFN